MCMTTSNNERKNVPLAKQFSNYLLLRKTANELFEFINNANADEIIIDFNNIQAVSRAFTHQYILNKKKSNKSIIDVNISPSVEPMFKLIEKQAKRISSLT